MTDSKKNKTVISAITSIVKAASYENKDQLMFYRFDENLMDEIREDADFLADKMAISPKQAVLFSIIVEMSKCDAFTKRELAEKFQTSFVELLSYEEDLKALESALIIKRTSRGSIYVGNDVLKCLERNKPFRKPEITNLKTFTIMSRITRLCRDLGNHMVDKEMALELIDAMILANPGTSISIAADKYGVLKKGAKREEYNEDYGWEDYENYDFEDSMCPAERMLFFAMCYRYQTCHDDEFTWWIFEEFFDENTLDVLQMNYKNERLLLQKNKVITYASKDGMVVKEHFKIEDTVKEEIFADCGGLYEGPPMSGLIKHQNIVEKPLFYDRPVEERLKTLNDLLSEANYSRVRKALEDKGMRTGFTCLFYGAPGTGKTESVYQIARKSKRDIIMADVSKLKSMWVGESEKNVKRLFSDYKEKARKSRALPILVFNEADAIFGIRRSYADRAIDKMENSLQNIILQEMESLNGILIATTNLTENLDKAFERRFLYKVRFDKPSAETRSRIWQSMLPELSESEALQLSSEYDFSGGQIENVARKKAVNDILGEKATTFTDIRSFCEEETLAGNASKRKIGF